MRQQLLAGGGQSGAAAAIEQAAADLVLEARDAGRQRGLGDVAMLGRGGEISRLGHREEVTNKGQIHGIDDTYSV